MDGKHYVMIVGAPKCGTTSLAAFAGTLPGAVVSGHKETLYFTSILDHPPGGPTPKFGQGLPRTEAEFRAQFDADPEAGLRVEASADNLSRPEASERILEFSQRADVASVKIVALLRDPVERIVSEYEHTLRMGWQTGSLMESLRQEDKRSEGRWHPLFLHLRRSRYAEQLGRYRSRFGAHLKIMDFHTLRDPESLAAFCDFVGAKMPQAEAELDHKNQRYVPKNRTIGKLLRSDTALKLSRAVVPSGLRPAIRKFVTPKNADRYTPSAKELDYIKSALREDIEACCKAPDIPTDHWTYALA